MKYICDEELIKNKVDEMTIEELKYFAFRHLRARELSNVRKRHERKLKKEIRESEKKNNTTNK